MNGSTLLLIHNVGFGISAVVGICAALFFVLYSKRSVANITLSLAFLAAVVFIISHVIGVNISDPLISRDVLMFNLSVFFIGAFNVHAVSAFLKRDHSSRYMIISLYVTSVICTVFFIMYPNLFLLPSIPKMYFPNYYNPGILNWIRLVFVFGICVSYMLFELIKVYNSSDNIQKRNQIRYFIIMIIGGYGAGMIPNFLIYNIPVDPLWGAAFLLFAAIPLIYASLKYEFMDIKIIAKQALGWLVLVEVIGIVISLFILFTDYIRQTFPELPIWILPIFFALVFVFVGAFIWRRLSETDILKYEFITVVTHKFRTPLTRIKWAAEDVASVVPNEKKASIDTILESEHQLLALTDILVHLSVTNASTFDYHPKSISVQNIFADLAVQYSTRADRKGVNLSFDSAPDLAVMIDPDKSIFIFQILIDNALSYTQANGSIRVRAFRDSDSGHIIIEVSDTGIGMSRETASRVFRRFYRGENARHADTEGMGIGLFMAKNIVEKQGGKISVNSDGEGKGSTFSVSLPAGRIIFTEQKSIDIPDSAR